MHGVTGAHPTEEMLLAFGLGKADEAATAAVARHLESCHSCRSRVASLPSDSFVERLQAVKASGSTSQANNSSPTHLEGTPTRPETSHVPAELARCEQYEAIRELGRGGMGVVYLARNKLMGRDEVLKVLNKSLLERPGSIDRFLREIQSAAKLQHPNVVAAHSAMQLGELLVFAMEYVAGQDLAQAVRNAGRTLPIANACYYAIQAAQGLQHAHDKGMVHRDIKPSNLILTKDGTKSLVKILDFGLAKVSSEKGVDAHLTAEGGMLGTPDFMAPEQALDASKADIRADIYSLGCTLYFLLTGRPPFVAKSLLELLQQHQESPVPSLNQLRPDAPAELSAAIARMMAKDPRMRYQTPAEVAKALAPFSKRPSVATAPPEESPDAVKSPARGSSTLHPDETEESQPAWTAKLFRTTSEFAAPPEEFSEPPSTESGTVALDAATRTEPIEAEPTLPQRGTSGRRVYAAIIVAFGLLFALGLLAKTIFKVKTPTGILEVEVNEPDVEVFVDGTKMTVSWDKGGKTAEIHIEPGTRRVEVVKDGFAAFGESVTLEDGKRRILKATLTQEKPTAPPPAKTSPNATARSVLDALKGDRVSPEALAIAGNGDPNLAPDSIVGILGEVFPTHSEAVLSLAYSPDGRWLATGSADKTIMLREASSGIVKRILKGHSGAVSALAFNPSSSTLVSASRDGTIRLWSVDREGEPQTVRPEIGEIWSMAASADGRYLAVGGASAAIKLWKWGEWNAAVDLPASKARTRALAFSQDGESLAAGPGEGKESSIALYRTSDGTLKKSWEVPPGPAAFVNALAFHPNGKWLAGIADYVRLWDVETGKEIAKALGSGSFNALAMHPEGKILYGCEIGGIGGWLYELPNLKRPSEQNGKAMKHFREPEGICCAAYSPNGHFLAFGVNDGSVHVWDFAREEKQLPERNHSHYIRCLSVSSDGRTLLSGGDDNAVRRWTLARPHESTLMVKAEFNLHHVAYNPDATKYVTSASFWDHVSDMGVVWDAATGKRILTVEPPAKAFRTVFSPDGKLLAGCNEFTGSIHLWDARSGKQLHKFEKIGTSQDAPAFSGDSKSIAAATADTKIVKVWDVASGEQLHSWLDAPMSSVAMSPDGRLLAAGHRDGKISLWELREKKAKQRVWEGHSARIVELKFTPDGKALVSSSEDGSIRVWRPEIARAIHIYSIGPPKRALTFDLDPSGKYLFAAGSFPVIFILRLPEWSDR